MYQLTSSPYQLSHSTNWSIKLTLYSLISCLLPLNATEDWTHNRKWALPFFPVCFPVLKGLCFFSPAAWTSPLIHTSYPAEISPFTSTPGNSGLGPIAIASWTLGSVRAQPRTSLPSMALSTPPSAGKASLPSSAAIQSPPFTGKSSLPLAATASPSPFAAFPSPPAATDSSPVPAPWKHYAEPAPTECPPVPAPRKRYTMPALPGCPQESAFPERPKSTHFQSAPKSLRLQSAPKCPRLQTAAKCLIEPLLPPRILFLGGWSSRAPAVEAGQGPGLRPRRQTRHGRPNPPDPPLTPELPDPPWPPKLTAPPWRCSTYPSPAPASRAPTTPLPDGMVMAPDVPSGRGR